MLVIIFLLFIIGLTIATMRDVNDYDKNCTDPTATKETICTTINLRYPKLYNTITITLLLISIAILYSHHLNNQTSHRISF